MSEALNVAIVTPTYNESKNIPKLVNGIKKAIKDIKNVNFTLVVVDDNSPDGTGKLAEGLAKKEKSSAFSMQVIHRVKKEGLGKAYVDAFKTLLKQDFDFILQMDADLSHNPKYIKDFVKEIDKGRDFVVASRYMRGGGTPDWTWDRKLQSRAGNFYTRVFLGSRITDYTGGYNLYAKNLLKKIDLDSLQAGGYGFLIELKFEALKRCTSVSQLPIVFMDRQHGTSKIPRNTLFANLLLVPKLRFGQK